ncbi:MAG: hypothetical protein KDK70_26000 [Myxococcales bacterium]|nr:hypothetical protein [Myxococcales bacterium]
MRHSRIARGALASLALSLSMAACAGRTPEGPLRTTPFPEPELTLVWHGTGAAYRHEGEGWARAPSQDYEFTVVQRRYADRWESTKTMHRRHPDYDGSAGPREQALHFTLDYAGERGATTPFDVTSSLGAGHGSIDREFRQATMELAAEVSPRAPFDHYRIDQVYAYEAGQLSETVQLLDEGRPWVKIEESARLFAEHRFEAAPGVAGASG